MTDAHGFTSISESAPLVAELRERIGRAGPLTFRDFMEAALYHPRWGYYATTPEATTRNGDYVTSPEVHPVFGAMLGRQLAAMWRALDRPATWRIVEQGAGRGTLARDIARWARAAEPAFFESIAYEIVEPLPALRHAQQRLLAAADGFDTRGAWRDEMPGGITGCVLSNELLDAFPVHRVVRQGTELLEVYVALDGDHRFVDRLDEPSTPALAAYFDALGLLPGDGCYAEVNLEAPRWIGDAARSLDRGYVLTFDYGYEAPDLYAPWRRDGTLLCFYRQSASSDPYQRIGKQDMTASLDFTTLRRAGEAAGLRTVGFTDQASFLVGLGITDGVAARAGEGSRDLEEYFARRNIVLELIEPAGLGRITVLAQGKRVPDVLGGGFG